MNARPLTAGLCLLTLFAACEEETPLFPSDTGTTTADSGNADAGTDSGTTGAVEVNAPCAGPDQAATLPAAFDTPANIYVETIVDAATRATEIRESLVDVPLPPANARIAEVDGISVMDGDIAYEWDADGTTYLYVAIGEGYQVYVKPEGSIRGTEHTFVDQDEACERFRYSKYAVEAGELDEVGTETFYSFDLAGTAKVYTLGHWIGDSPYEYNLRIFDDLSGDLQEMVDGDTVLSLLWNADGTGQYRILADGEVTEEGTW